VTNKGESFSNPYPKNPVLKITKAVINDKKELIGIIGIEYNMENILDRIKNSTIGKTGFVQIVNSNGTALLYPTEKDISISMSIKSEILKEKNGRKNYNWDKKEKFITYKEIKKLNWLIIGDVYVEEFKQDLKNVKIVNNYIIFLR